MFEKMEVRTPPSVGVTTCRDWDDDSRNGAFVNQETRREARTRKRRGNFNSALCRAGILLCLIAISEALDPPVIFPSGKNESTISVYIEAGQNLELTCYGDEPLTWSWGMHYGSELDDPRVNITTPKRTSSMTRPHASTLTLTDITYTDAGYFACQYPEDREGNDTEASIYIHVQDEDHLLITGDSSSLPFIDGITGGQVVIPCRPSWPEVKIELVHETNPSHPIPLGKNYSIESGYRIRNLKAADGGKYDCKGTFNGRQQIQVFLLQVNSVPANDGNVYSPNIKVTNFGHLAVGEDFDIVCYAEQKSAYHFTMDIQGPLNVKDPRVTFTQGAAFHYFNRKAERKDYKSWFQRYHVKGARPEDTGTYECKVQIVPNGGTRTRYTQITVFDEGESFLNLSTVRENIVERENNTARWVLNISSFPIDYNFTWRNPQGAVIDADKSYKKYRVSMEREQELVLEILDVVLEDAGFYPFTVDVNGTEMTKTLNLSLTVNAAPKVALKTNGPKLSFLENVEYELYCEVRGYPTPTIVWKYGKCDEASICEPPVNITETTREVTKHGFKSVVEFNATSHGKYFCSAKNSLAREAASAEQVIRIVDFNGDAEMFAEILEGDDRTVVDDVVEGDDIKLDCALSKFKHKANDLVWTLEVNGVRQPVDEGMVKSEETKWSWRKIVTFDKIQHSATGRYVCENEKVSFMTAGVTIDVLNVSAPELIDSNLTNTKISMKQGGEINLTCHASGKPNPEINWTWEDLPVNEWPSEVFKNKYYFSNGNSVLHLKSVLEDAQGRYMCTARNRNGTASGYLDIAVTGTQIFSFYAIAIILILFVVVIIFGVGVCRYKHKQGKLDRFLKEISQKDFYKGAVENINPDLSVADQAYLLPFDSRLEFPKERLKLGIQLGSGAFGRVIKAEACGILSTEPLTTVAVKMVKPNADESHFKALMSELKIMVHLGQHINVVNILGACTKNLAKKKELFVIVEYCKYGSLLSYMHRNKRTFINQLDPSRGSIDPTIDRGSEQSQMPRIHYAQLTFTDPGNSRKPARNGYRTLDEFNQPIVDDPPTPTLHPLEGGSNRDNMGYPSSSHVDFLTPNRRSTEHYVSESQAESACTGITMMTTDGTTKRRSSCGSQWQDHYRGDYQAREVQPIKTTDLLSWAFQIARGMDYLATRKVLHGDLAARNVLLAENNVVKICDFGLAKEMYKDYKYKKKSENVLLPVKWMAIESIYYGVFSTQSDCWSFGVVLWELFTLGKTPYPGMDADEKFYKKISEGYRMEKPPLAPSCVYDIMLECWSQEPTERPSFPELVDRIGDMMEDRLRNHYVDLNSAYMQINQTNMAGRPDYLLQMGRSEFASDSRGPTPQRQYQNLPDEQDSSGYLKPIRPSGATSATPAAPHAYQNVQQHSQEPSCSLLANNTGYMFIKSPVNDDTAAVAAAEMNSDDPPTCTLQIRYSPDIKDVFGLREDSVSPDRYSDPDRPAVDDNHIELQLGTDGIRGVDNMNYVPSHLLFTKSHINGAVPSAASPTEEAKIKDGIDRKSADSNGGRRQKRQKNDSGLGSIDSNQFDSQHPNNVAPEISELQEHCGDFGHRQQANGYVSHQNISSFS